MLASRADESEAYLERVSDSMIRGPGPAVGGVCNLHSNGQISDKVGTESLSKFTAEITARKQLGKDILSISLHPYSSLFDPLQLVPGVLATRACSG